MMNTLPSHEVSYARVYILDNPFSIDRAYDYYIPYSIENVVPGAFVTVPFGRGNRKLLALVTAVLSSDDSESAHLPPPDKIKPLGDVCTERLFLDAEQLSLCFYLKEQTLCTIGEAVRCVIPASALARLTEYLRPSDRHPPTASQLSAADLMVYEYICTRGCVSVNTAKGRFGAQVADSIDRLLDKRLIEKELNLTEPTVKTETYYSLAHSVDVAEAILGGDKSAPVKLTAPKQRAALAALIAAGGRASASALTDASGATRQQFGALVQKGIFIEEQVEAHVAEAEAFGDGCRTPHQLNDEQASAVRTLSELAASGDAKAALLHGVTGSGKTCVILEMIDRMLDAGRGVIVLLPEISLTPQMLAIFRSRYGRAVAVIHSGLSAGERMDSHVRISRGDATVVVGTRSAVFAPVKNLGMIVMDEEQEHTYKSDMNPKYHARDIARYRCASNRALLLLASATPSLESYKKAKDGKYTLIRMTTRFSGAPLPRVDIVDMRGEGPQGNVTPLGTALSHELVRTYKEGDQSVLFLNRRGYSNQLVCRSCGQAVRCSRCSVAMHYHTRRGSYAEGELVCHWCGSRTRTPDVCPECGSPHLTRMGYGTQRIEQELDMILPDARVMRMDADTTNTKTAFHDMLGAFRRREADILLGTQMVTKGHDFPAVTLVGVLMADASLYLDDYRASERTFSMLTQVIGRAGRGEKHGMAVIQTMNPDSDVMKLACAQDYETFYEREIKLRRLLVFPPFCDIVLLSVTSPNEAELQKACVRLKEELNMRTGGDFQDVPVVAFGPFEAPVYRVDNVYRMRMIIKCRLNKRARALFSDLLTAFAEDSHGNSNGRRPVLSIDFNPSSI